MSDYIADVGLATERKSFLYDVNQSYFSANNKQTVMLLFVVVFCKYLHVQTRFVIDKTAVELYLSNYGTLVVVTSFFRN